MALNAYEEITIINNDVSPDATTLQELVHQIGTQFAEDFMKSYKIFPTTEVIDDPENPGTDITVSINQEATSYLNKMISISGRMYKVDGAAVNSLKRIVVVLLGELAPDYQFVIDMGDDIWENFVNIVMVDAFELSSGVRQEEKTEYNAL